MRLGLLALWCAAIIVLAACSQTTPAATATAAPPTRDATAQPVIAVAVTATAAATVVPTATRRPVPTPSPTPTRIPSPTPTPVPLASVEVFSRIERAYPDLAKALLGFPWLADGVSEHEQSILFSLWVLADQQPGLARRLLSLSWLTDDITEQEREAVYYLVALDHASPSLAEQVMSLSWFRDGIAEEEWQAISYISDFAILDVVQKDPSLARRLMDLQPLPIEVVVALYSLGRDSPGHLEQLFNQWWFQDGLTDEESALIVVLPSTLRQEAIFQGLIEGGHVISDVFSLPLTGQVNLYAVSRSPLQHDVLGVIRIALETMEDFMSSPWSYPNIIVLVDLEWEGPSVMGVLGDYGTPYVPADYSPITLYQLIGNHYFKGMPRWLAAGGEGFLKTYTLHRTKEAPSNLYYRGVVLQTGVLTTCAQHGASTIQELIDAPSEKKGQSESGHGPLAQCHHYLGEAFLLGMYVSLGHEVVKATLHQLYELHASGHTLTEDDIYQAFLSNTPQAKQSEFQDLYACLHGRQIPGYKPAPTATTDPQRAALVALYNSTNGSGWKNNANWLIEAPIDQWHGVVTSCGRVIELSLPANNLAGPLPPDLGSLSRLARIDLQDNALTGPIPPELGNLSNLQGLFLGNNELTGPIPSELGNLSNLTSLDLAQNQLTGAIPPELGSLSNLTSLVLFQNQLTGAMPPELGSLSTLRSMYLSNNELTGPIPAELGNLPRLHRLFLGGNELTGSIPPELGNLSNLTSLGLVENRLIGRIPPGLGSLSNLKELYLASNELNGPIPLELGNLSSLETLYLNNNELTGLIPSELGKLSSLEKLYLNNNELTGLIPSELGKLSNLGYLSLYRNQLTGTIPTELGDLPNLKVLYLADNELTGCIPKALQGMESNDFKDTNLPFC